MTKNIIEKNFIPKYVTDDFSTSYRNEVSNFVADLVEKKKNSDSDEKFLQSLSEYDKLAYLLSSFKNSITNIKYFDHFYSVDKKYYISTNDLKKFIEKSDYQYKDKLIQILDDYSFIYNSSDKTNLVEIINKRENILKDYENIYNSFTDYFENYFIKNMPEEYKTQIVNSRSFKI